MEKVLKNVENHNKTGHVYNGRYVKRLLDNILYNSAFFTVLYLICVMTYFDFLKWKMTFQIDKQPTCD